METAVRGVEASVEEPPQFGRVGPQAVAGVGVAGVQHVQGVAALVEQSTLALPGLGNGAAVKKPPGPSFRSRAAVPQVSRGGNSVSFAVMIRAPMLRSIISRAAEARWGWMEATASLGTVTSR